MLICKRTKLAPRNALELHKQKFYGVSAATGVALLAVLSGCGQSNTPASSTQLAAKVNKGEISVHQVNFVLQKQSIKPEVMPKVRKDVLDRLIDQEVVVQQALADQLDRDPEILQRLESARREILARSYVEKVASKVDAPLPNEIEEFFAAKPFLFANRKIYKSSEIAFTSRPPEWPALLKELESVKSLDAASAVLKRYKLDLPVSRNVSKGSEALPIDLLPTFDKLKVGDVAIYAQEQQIIIAEIEEIKDAPVTKAQAGPVIQQFMMNQRRSDRVKADLQRLKTSAQIAYLGEFIPAATKATEGMRAADTKATTDPKPAATDARQSTQMSPVGAAKDPAAKPSADTTDALTKGLQGVLK